MSRSVFRSRAQGSGLRFSWGWAPWQAWLFLLSLRSIPPFSSGRDCAVKVPGHSALRASTIIYSTQCRCHSSCSAFLDRSAAFSPAASQAEHIDWGERNSMAKVPNFSQGPPKVVERVVGRYGGSNFAVPEFGEPHCSPYLRPRGSPMADPMVPHLWLSDVLRCWRTATLAGRGLSDIQCLCEEPCRKFKLWAQRR